MSAEYKSAKLMMDAEKLITPNAFDENGGISAIHQKSKRVLKNNKLGFDKFVQAAKLNVHFQAHFNLAEFYFSGLDGATTKDVSKSAHHYFKAWKLTNNKMTKSVNPSNQFEGILFNFCGVLEKINVANGEIFDSSEILKAHRLLNRVLPHHFV